MSLLGAWFMATFAPLNMNTGLHAPAQPETSLCCYHCGETCATLIRYDDHYFCCSGCRAVYEILAKNNLCTYYSLSEKPGNTQQRAHLNTYYDFLDQPHVVEQMVHFREGAQFHVRLSIPNMHCSSCIWLLENLHKLEPGVISSRVTFLDREIQIVFNSHKVSLKGVVLLLRKVGYEPSFSLDDLNKREGRRVNRKQLYKIGIAGFCFGNTMMLSLPDYFSGGNFLNDAYFSRWFNYLSLGLSLPVFFYCASEFFSSSWQQLKLRKLNIDIPIAFAILVTFAVSLWLILVENRMGFLDSMSGIVFFMLVGRFFQNRSYHYLSFQKSFSSYLPIAVNRIRNGVEHNIPLIDLSVGDEIVLRQQEIVATDGVLLNEEAWFDYSFVTGESAWVHKRQHEVIYAGAIQKSAHALLKVLRKPSQSYITQLWNSRINDKYADNTVLTTERINVWFSAAVLLLGTLACMYWISRGDYSIGLRALVTVWIVACPCALLLCTTFTYGNMLSILAHNGLYIKNAAVMEKMRLVSALVFDKTGTLTHSSESQTDFVGRGLTEEERAAVYSLAQLSIHPLSKAVAVWIGTYKSLPVSDYVAADGKGLEGKVGGLLLRLGSAFWVGARTPVKSRYTRVYLQVNGEIAGYFEVRNRYRSGIFEQLRALREQYGLHMISGDNDAEAPTLEPVFGADRLRFNQLPEHKTAYIRNLQTKGHAVMMIGDGLNDAQAFSQSDAGVAVIENENNFLPACDVILLSNRLALFPDLMGYIRRSRAILVITFSVSLIYNVVGLSFAMRGDLTPVVAAILMPISTVSVVSLSFLLSRYYALRRNLQT